MLARSSWKASYVALFLVSHVTGITGTIFDHAQHAAYSLTHGAHVRRFELAIRSRNPEWYRKGAQLFAYELNGYFWNLKTIRWGIRSDSYRLSAYRIGSAFAQAFEMWGKHIPITFEQVSLEEEANIRISSDFLDRSKLIEVQFVSPDPLLDLHGVNIIFNDRWNWNDVDKANYRDIWFAALNMVGCVLGLGESDDPDAIMFGEHGGFTMREDLALHPDDIRGIKELFKDPLG